MHEIKYEGQEPFKKHEDDAGYDLFLQHDVNLIPGKVTTVNLEFKVEIPKGCMGILLPRGGSAKRGILVQIPPIDCGYSGDIHAMLFLAGDEPVFLEKGERVCQLVIVQPCTAEFVKGTVKPGDRGENRFNSTGR